MKKRFEAGQKVVCNTRNWFHQNGAPSYGNPGFNEIVTIRNYTRALLFGKIHVITLVEYPGMFYAETEFEPQLSDIELSKLLNGQSINV